VVVVRIAEFIGRSVHAAQQNLRASTFLPFAKSEHCIREPVPNVVEKSFSAPVGFARIT
jgi:hypothetical protein